MTARRRRLDTELVRLGLVADRSAAHALIDAGRVLVAGAPAANAARFVDPAEPIVIVAPPARFVSRGGEKLDAALTGFDVAVEGRRVLDAGASTGGFTDCLLQRGAASVVALDVGTNQLHERLRADPRVVSIEQTDIRRFQGDEAGAPFPLVVADLSFVSLSRVLDALLARTAPGGDLVVLVKPQFEAEKADVSRGRGVIRDPEIWRRALATTIGTAVDRGAAIMGAMVSPLRGADGNVEFFVHLQIPSTPGPRAPASGAEAIDLDALVRGAAEGG